MKNVPLRSASATTSSDKIAWPQRASAAAVVDFPAPSDPTNATACSPNATALACRQVTPRRRNSSPSTGPSKYVAVSSIARFAGHVAQTSLAFTSQPELRSVKINKPQVTGVRGFPNPQRWVAHFIFIRAVVAQFFRFGEIAGSRRGEAFR